MASAGYLSAVFLLGTLGPPLLGAPLSTLEHALQPPAFLSAPEHVTGTCLGPVEGGRCHGTLRYPLGTNGHGHGLLRLVASGAAVSVKVAMVVASLVIPIALAVGVVAGHLGGRVDALLMRYVDVQTTVPAVLVYVIGIYVFGRSLLAFVLVFGLLSWGGVARQVRSEVRQLGESGFIRAARESGASDGRVLRRHVVPNVAGVVVTATTQRIPEIVLFEAALSFLQLNDTGVRSWGYTITTGFQLPHAFLDVWWISVIPVVCLGLTVVALACLGDALRDAVDPTHDAVG